MRTRRARFVDWVLDEAVPFLIFGLMVCAISAGLIGLVVWGVYTLEKNNCTRTLTAMDREGRFGFWEQCLIEDQDGNLVPLDNWREFDR